MSVLIITVTEAKVVHTVEELTFKICQPSHIARTTVLQRRQYEPNYLRQGYKQLFIL